MKDLLRGALVGACVLVVAACSKGTETDASGTGGNPAVGVGGTGGQVIAGAGGSTPGSGGHSVQGTGGGPGSGGQSMMATGGNGGASGGMTGAGGGPPSSSGGAAPGTGGADPGTGGTSPTSACEEALSVRLVGRYSCVSGGAEIAWSGSGFIARFEGTGLRLRQKGGSIIYTVVVDGVVAPELVTQEGEQTYDLVSGLELKEHRVELYRQGEASFGVSALLGVEAVGGQLLPPVARSARRIEIFGDSITCGYGNEGTSPDCDFTPDTENHYLTYGALLARHFDAELSTVAWSGKGVVVNYNGEMGETMPDMVHRVDGSAAQSVWDYSLVPQPQLVLINLGTNDFSTDNDPDHATFTATYVSFLEAIRQKYPDAHIICTNGPLLSGDDLAKARQGIAAAVQARKDAGDTQVSTFELSPENPAPGCHYHPSLVTHVAMAEELKAPIAAALGW